MTRYYCTYFDSNYLLKGVALLRSLGEQERGDCVIFAVCMDAKAKCILDKLSIPCVVPMPLSYIEENDEALLEAKQNRSAVEYLWTCTPTIIRWILLNIEQVDLLTYVDADLFFFSDPTPIFKEMGAASVLIHEHRFPPDLRYLERYGKYNVGLVSFRKDGKAIEVLSWWRARCLECCSMNAEEGKFGDQAYLDDWQTLFQGVSVLQNPAAGLAPWNHTQYAYTQDETGRFCVNAAPVIFYHFHRFFHLIPEIHVLVHCELYRIPVSIVRLCFGPYLRALLAAFAEVRQVDPDFSCGFQPHETLPSQLAFVAHTSTLPTLRAARPPHREIVLDADWVLFASEQIVE